VSIKVEFPTKSSSLGLTGSSGGSVVRYLRSYLFVFDSRNWVLNLLFISLCSFIPIIGPMVLTGYFFEVIDFLLRRDSRRRDGSFENYSEAITVEPVPEIP